MIECGECQDRLAEHVLRHEPSATDDSIAEHLLQCDVCRGVHDEMLESLALLPLALAPVQVDPSVEARTMQRVLGIPPVTLPRRSSRFWESKLWQYSFAVTVMICLITSYYHYRSSGYATTAGLTPEEVASSRELARRIDALRDLGRDFATQKLRYVSFFGSASDVAGYLVYDLVGYEAYFFYQGAATPPHGASFVIWLLDVNGNVLASKPIRFADDVKGATLQLPSDLTSLRQAIVTVEHGQGPWQQPSGEVKMRAPIELTVDSD